MTFWSLAGWVRETRELAVLAESDVVVRTVMEHVDRGEYDAALQFLNVQTTEDLNGVERKSQ